MKKQYKLVKLSKDRGYDRFSPLWFKNNNIEPDSWYLELLLLQKWFRDVKFLDIIVEPDFDKGFYDWYTYNQEMEDRVDCSDQIHQTYEKALEEGLYNALKLLK